MKPFWHILHRALFALMVAALCGAGTASAGAVEHDLVNVSNVTELMLAMRSNRTIILAPGEYNLTTWVNAVREEQRAKGNRIEGASHLYSVGEGGETVIIHDTQVELNGFYNLQLRGADTKALARIVTNEAYDSVFRVLNGSMFTIMNIAMGHNAQRSTCSGAVLDLHNMQLVTITNSVLFGCGTYGFTASHCSDFNVFGTTITECSCGCFRAVYCDRVAFTNSVFRDCESVSGFFDGENTTFKLENCSFINLRGNIANVFIGNGTGTVQPSW